MNHIPENRLTTPDFLKGIAVICMIQVHLTELFATYDIYTSNPGRFSLFLGAIPAAPVFMSVMGYFLFQAEDTKKSLFRGLKIIFLGLLLNIGLNAHLLIKIYQGAYQFNPYNYIFGVDILFLAGISILVISILKIFLKSNVWLWLLFATMVAFAGMVLPQYSGESSWIYYVEAVFWGKSDWSYFPVFPWLVYPLLGIVYQLIETKKIPFIDKILLSNYTLPVLFLLNIPFIKFGFDIAIDLPSYYHHSLLFVLWAIVFMAFWILVFHRINNLTISFKINRYICWIGKNVTAFYVFQWLIIGNIATSVFRTQSFTKLTVWFVFIILAISLLVLVWRALQTKFRNRIKQV